MIAPPRPKLSYLSNAQCEYFADSVRNILTQKGWLVKSERLRNELAGYGCTVRKGSEAVLLTDELLDRFFSDVKAKDFKRENMRFFAGGYPTQYLDYRDNQLKNNTTSSVLELMTVAEKLPGVDWMSSPGTMFDVPLYSRPFYTKIMIWKYGRKTRGSFEFTQTAEYPLLKELAEKYSEIRDVPVHQSCSGRAYRDYPLVFSKDKIDMFYCFKDDGFRFDFAHAHPVIGLQSPVTIAGGVLSSLLDGITSSLFSYLLFNDTKLVLMVPSVVDLSSGIPRKATPECTKLLMGVASMADFYGASELRYYSGFRSQGKSVMSYQNGAERASHLMAAYLCGATSCGSMGSISEPDTIFSLPQLALDNELAMGVKYYLSGFQIEDRAMAVDELLNSRHDANFLDSYHTVEFMREKTHINRLFIGACRYEQFIDKCQPDEYTLACESIAQLLAEPLPALLDEEEEKYLLETAKKADKLLAP